MDDSISVGSRPNTNSAVFGLGQAMVDISCEVDDDFLKRFGLKPNDQVMYNAGVHGKLFESLADEYEHRIRYSSGGGTLNVDYTNRYF